MKTRNGFVSNSSSASFIVTWCVETNDETTVAQAVERLLDVCSPPEDDDVRRLHDELIEHTKLIVRAGETNMLETRFWVPMLNEPMNFGNAAAQLLLALEVQENWGESSAKKVRSKVEYDY